MIYTVTFNPCLDYIIQVDGLKLGLVNRTAHEEMLAGGKGVNVSIVLRNLGHENRALGFLAGFTGAEIAHRLRKTGVEADFIEVGEGMSRINVKINSDGVETEINGMGPAIQPEDVEALYAKLDKLVAGDTLIISGSVPSVLPGDIYERIMARLEGSGVSIVVDATRDLLVNVLPYHPFLIKPNNHELGEIFDVELRTREEVVPWARKLQEGAVLVAEDGSVHESPAPRGHVVNSVGAGDSMVAGFVAGYAESGGDYETAFRMGVCTGSASAFSMQLATRDEVEALLSAL